jgi:ABC-type antimicrobial peptide transport system permease subunit
VEYYDEHPDSIGGMSDDVERSLPELESGWMLAHERYTGCLSINDINAMPVKPELTRGTYPQSGKGIIISSEYSTIDKLGVGSKFEDTGWIKDEETGQWNVDEVDRTVCGIYSSLGYGMDVYSQYFPKEAEYLDVSSYINIMSDDFFTSDDGKYGVENDEGVAEDYTQYVTVYITYSDKHNIVSQTQEIAEAFGIDKGNYLVSDYALEKYYRENSKEPTSYAMFRLILVTLGALTAMAIIFIVRNSFNISVHERSQDYGILRCIGLTRRQIIRIILYEAFAVGIVGTVLGMLVGYGFCKFAFYSIGKYFSYLGSYSVAPVSVLWTVICMLAATCYAMVGPIQRLYSLNPIEALRKMDEVESAEKALCTKKAVKRSAKQAKKSSRITRRFGIEAGYAYRNLMRTRGRFLLVVVTLSIGGSLYIGGGTFSKLLTEDVFGTGSMYDDFSGFFNCLDRSEYETIKNDLSSLSCVSNGKVTNEVTLQWEAKDTNDSMEIAYFIGLEQQDYDELLAQCGVDFAESGGDIYNVIQIENFVEGDFDIPLKAGHTFNIQTTVFDGQFQDFASELHFSFFAENYQTGKPIYVYPVDSGFEALFDAGFSDDLYTYDIQNEYTYNIYVNDFASDYYKFENYIDNTTHRYVDETFEIKIVMNIFRFIEFAINTVIILVLLIFFINSINIQHSQMQLREDEFNILRVIGMSRRQLKKSLIIENMAGVVSAAFWSVVLGTIGGNVIIRALEWLEQIDDEVSVYSRFTVDIKSVAVVIALLLVLGFASAALANKEEENRL